MGWARGEGIISRVRGRGRTDFGHRDALRKSGRPAGGLDTRRRTRSIRGMDALLSYLAANPLLLVPVLIVAAMAVVAILKKLLKLAAVLAVAGLLYIRLLRYLEGGL